MGYQKPLFDNGSQYKTKWMNWAYAKMGIRLLFARPHSPVSTGKIEPPRHFYKGLLEQLGCKSKILQGRMLNRSCTEKTHAGYPPPAAHGAMLTRPTYWIEKCSKRFGPYLISRWMLRVLWS